MFFFNGNFISKMDLGAEGTWETDKRVNFTYRLNEF